MSTSVTENKRPLLKRVIVYASASAFCFVFSQLYGLFSHGVSSVYMTYMFVFPLVLGALPGLIFLLTRLRPPARVSDNIWNAGVAAATVSSLLRGILEIAGTGSKYQQTLMYAAGAMLAAGFVLYLAKK